MALSSMKAKKLKLLQPQTPVKVILDDGTTVKGKILENDGESLELRGQTILENGAMSEWVETVLDYEELKGFFVLTGETSSEEKSNSEKGKAAPSAVPKHAAVTMRDRLRQYLETGEKPDFWVAAPFETKESGDLSQYLNAVSNKEHRKMMQPAVDKLLYGRQHNDAARMDEAIRLMQQLLKQSEALEQDVQVMQLASAMLYANSEDGALVLEQKGFYYDAAQCLLHKQPHKYENRMLTDVVLAIMREDSRRAELYSMLFYSILVSGDASPMPTVVLRFPDEASYTTELIALLSEAACIEMPTGDLIQQMERLAKQFPAGMPAPTEEQPGEVFSYNQEIATGQMKWSGIRCTFNLSMVSSARLREYLKSLHKRNLDEKPIGIIIQLRDGVPVSLREDPKKNRLEPERLNGEIYTLMWATEEGKIRTPDGSIFSFRYKDLSDPLKNRVKKLMVTDLTGREIAVSFQAERGQAIEIKGYSEQKKISRPPEQLFQAIKGGLNDGTKENRFRDAMRDLTPLLDTSLCGQVMEQYLRTAVAQFKQDNDRSWLAKAAQVYRKYQNKYPSDKSSLRTLVTFSSRLGDTELILASVNRLMGKQTRKAPEETAKNDIAMCIKLCQSQYRVSGDQRLLECCSACLDTVEACLPKTQWSSFANYRMFLLVETGDLESAAAFQEESEKQHIPISMDSIVAKKLADYRKQKNMSHDVSTEQSLEDVPKPAAEPLADESQDMKEEPIPELKKKYNLLPALPVRTVKITLEDGIFKNIDCPGMDGNTEAVKTVWQLLVQGSAPSALLYTKALTRGVPELWQPIYDMLAYAYNDPLLTEPYEFAKLQTVYDADVHGCTTESVRCYELCTLLRMLFADTVDENILYSVNESMIRAALSGCTLYQEVDAFPTLFQELCNFIHDYQQGFGLEACGKVKSLSETKQQKELVLTRAKELAEMRLDVTDARNARLNGLRQKLFGRDGTMKTLIQIAAEDHVEEKNKGMCFCQRFQKTRGMVYKIDENQVNQYIDEIWESTSTLTTNRKTERLVGAQRQSIIKKVETYLQTYCQWAELCEVKDTDSNPYLIIRNRLLTQVEQAQKQIIAIEKKYTETLDAYAALVSVVTTLSDIELLLRSGKDNRPYFYLGFVTSNHVELDTATVLPMLDESVSILPGYELWNRVLLHEQDKIPFEEYQDQVLRGKDVQEYDFGRQLIVIWHLSDSEKLPEGVTLEQLNALEEQVARNVDAMPTELQRMERKFDAEMELAEAYGRFADLGTKDRILHEFRDWYRPSADHSCNYGYYGRAMNVCCVAVDRDAQRMRGAYLEKLDRLKEDLGTTMAEQKDSILDTISELVDEEKYSVADDYIRLARNGYREAPDTYVESAKQSDYFEQFLTEYDTLFRRYGQQAGRTLFEIYRDYQPEHKIRNRTQKDAYDLIETWPRGDTARDDSIAAFLVALGLSRPRQLQRVSAGGENTEEKTLSWHYLPEQTGGSAFECDHPIAAFGSRLSRDGLTIRLVLGRADKDKIMSVIHSYGATGGPVVILLDYFLALPERRMIAAAMKREGTNARTMILIDRILAVFLANVPKAERIKAMLQCTLPFTWMNPYHKSSASVIPPEMFMGRREELRSILEPSGTHIIYGGRQLGKTALLQRAKSWVDNSALGDWAVYLSVKEKTEEQVLAKIYTELVMTGFLDAGEQVRDWDGLCLAIRSRMQSPEQPVVRFLLLLDEADAFLQSCEKTGYIIIDQLLDLQSTTEDRFKFVLAGLHNVLRYSRRAMDNNVSLMRLSPLCIKPLKYSDGSELLEKPLFYLGFRVKPEHTPLISQILSTCNYYPGLIHYYVYQLLNKMELNQTNDTDAPPYYLDETQIRNLLQDPDFNEQIKEKLFITLGVDASEGNHYRILAYALAYRFHTDKVSASFGFTAVELMHTCEQFGIRSISEMDEYTVHALLDEMVELNVLQTTDKKQYSFNRRSFLEMLGDEVSVMEELYRFADTK